MSALQYKLNEIFLISSAEMRAYMFEREMQKYNELNKLATSNGMVIVGCGEDKEIPLCELKQAFELDSNLYNRSLDNLSILNACQWYDACVAPLYPETVILHLGEADLELFQENSSTFVQKYQELIAHIRKIDKKCNIAMISLKNPNHDNIISELNKHLKYIAESEHCEYGDISTIRVWNPKETKDVMSFVYSLGFVRPLRSKRPIYDLAKVLFCYESFYANAN